MSKRSFTSLRRALSLLCAAALVAALTLLPASAASFPDVQPEDWYYDTVSRMAELGAVDGFPDGTFGPERSISLTELCKIGIELFPGPALEEHFTTQELAEGRAYMAEVNPGYWGNDVILEALLLRDVHGLGFDRARWEQPLTRMELTYVVSNIYLTSDAFPTSGDPDTADPSATTPPPASGAVTWRPASSGPMPWVSWAASTPTAISIPRAPCPGRRPAPSSAASSTPRPA